MKRKFLLAFIVAIAVCCIFATVICADGIKRFETDEFQSGDNITYLDGISEDMYYTDNSKNNSFYELLDSSFTARAVVQNSDGTYTTYPSWYFMSFNHYWNGAEYEYFIDRINTMTDVTGETYKKSDIIRFELPEYKENHNFSIKKSMGSLSMSGVKYVRVASHFTSTGGAFRGATSLTEIEYAPNSCITTIYNNTFIDCVSLEVIRIPNSATTMGNEVVCFWNKSSSDAALKEIYLGASMSSLGTKDAIRTADVTGLKIYVPSTLDGSTYSFAKYFPSKSMLIFTGTKEEAESFGAPKVISYLEYVNTGFAHEAGTIVYGYSACDAFYNGQHVEISLENNPCVSTVCERCNYKVYIGNETTHTLKTDISYTSYDIAGIKNTFCLNEACEHTVTEIASPLLVCQGYSIPQNDSVGITIGFRVNNDAINEYTNLTGKAVEYGLFAVSQTMLGENDVIDGDGNATDGVIKADVSKYTLDSFIVKITGFGTDNLKAENLALGAYVIVTSNESKSISYIQSGTPNENENYYFVSYNDLTSTQNQTS